MENASLYRRFFAFLFDLVIIDVMYGLMLIVGLMARQARGEIVGLESYGGFDIPFLFRLWMFIFVFYNMFFLYIGGQTPAKMLFKIKVVSVNGEPLSFMQALLRAFSYFFSFFLFIGFIMAIFTKKKRSLHDFISRSIVLETGSGMEVNFVVEQEHARRYL